MDLKWEELGLQSYYQSDQVRITKVTFAQKWLRQGLQLARNQTTMGYGFWEASCTYPAKINPSNPSPDVFQEE